MKLIGTKEICEMFGVDIKTLSVLARTTPGFPVRKLGGRWKADPEELREWWRDRPTVQAKPEPIRLGAPRREQRRVSVFPAYDIRIP